MSTKFYNRTDAAARVGKSVATIYRWERAGVLTFFGALCRESDLLEADRTVRARTGRPASSVPTMFADIEAERERQFAKWGEQNHPDGTGLEPLLAVGDTRPAREVAEAFQSATSDALAVAEVTWADILLEEVFEAIAETDPEQIRAELIQVAAVAVQWAEAIERRLK